MMMALLLLLLQLLLLAANAQHVLQMPSTFSEVCYPGLGCFRSDGHFFDRLHRPITVLPQSPEDIGARFYLFTRYNKNKAQEIKYGNENSVKQSNFDGNLEIKVIIHGFRDGLHSGWMLKMKNALLNTGDYNVILADWSGGNGFPYTQATANTRVVGAQLWQLLQWLESKFGASRLRSHFIGHSLGAHISGYAGSRLSGKLGRITGMDPAGPYFEYMHPQVRLDPSDAQFVDAIHTDGSPTISIITLKGGFGMMQAVGHVDFYPNGGKYQTPCLGEAAGENPTGAVAGLSCHHGAVLDYVLASMQNPNRMYIAVPCSSYEDYKANKCKCGNIGCASMGMSANKWNPYHRLNVKMYLDTKATYPY